MRRLDSIKSKFAQFSQDQNSLEANIKDIDNFISKDLKQILGKLQLNSFFSQCMLVTSNNQAIEFKPHFTATPDVFVVANKFIIDYGTEGSLSKFNISYEVLADKIKFDIDKAANSISVPVCVLAIEKKSA